jgi:hypothetical protein
MGDHMAEADEDTGLGLSDLRKSPKTFVQRLISRDSIPTVYAVFSALAFLGNLKDLSNLSQYILGHFDAAVGMLAGGLSDLIGFEVSKSMLLYSGAVFFGLGGILALFRKEKPFRNQLEVYLSLLSVLLISVTFVSKLEGFDYSIVYEGELWVLILGYIVIAFVAYAILHYLLKLPILLSYVLAGAVLPTLVPTLIFAAQYGSPGTYPQIFGSFIVITALLALFALNPKRLRQVAMLMVVFGVLALISAPLNKVVPSPDLPQMRDSSPMSEP